ncbi:hypothetical protein [Natronomonas sp. EA1]|uniref:hypothetical protein n=1 Tax=Natronomonas sp. EA1 TaxID=3421655 RepID=UPI003EB813B7
MLDTKPTSDRVRAGIGTEASHYDGVLAAVPAAFLLAAGLAGAGVPTHVALGVGGVVGLLAVLYGLFVTPPR